MTKYQEAVEAAARAICRANCSHNPEMNDEDIECQVANGWGLWEREAQAALTAALQVLREPSEGMLEVAIQGGRNVACNDTGAWVVDPDFVAGYQAMLDAVGEGA